MKIKKITLHNFRIYRKTNLISFNGNSDKNVNIISGKNGFGKTTFLTSLIWVFYGKLMAQVEEKYNHEIKSKGGYKSYLKSLINNKELQLVENGDRSKGEMFVEIELTDLMIPSIPCESVKIKRSVNIKTKTEKLDIQIEGAPNQLTKEVGYEVFINDFILPREIAKFFFFDAEKIVSLAEAKTTSELRSLSKAYSEVLGIKKYEDLKKSLQAILQSLKRRGISIENQNKIKSAVKLETKLNKQLEDIISKETTTELELLDLRMQSDHLQEQLIREGTGMTLDRLKELKEEGEGLKVTSQEFKSELKKMLELAPFAIALNKLTDLFNQVKAEQVNCSNKTTGEELLHEITKFSNELLSRIDVLNFDSNSKKQIQSTIDSLLKSKTIEQTGSKEATTVLVDFNDTEFLQLETFWNHIKYSFKSDFNQLVIEEKKNRALLNKNIKTIREAEARKGSIEVLRFRDEKEVIDSKVKEKSELLKELQQEQGGVKHQLDACLSKISEYEKNFKLEKTDIKKFHATEKLLERINLFIQKIKQEKKHALEKSIKKELQLMMHKEDFIHDVQVRIENDIMDVDLLDGNKNVISKDDLSKGEQQLYATTLLKALVDQSGITFPVFIDSPLQKFDSSHSKNIVKEFYPHISKQVVIFPLLGKELSEEEFGLLQPHLNQIFTIENKNKSSSFLSWNTGTTFNEIAAHVYSS